MLKVTSSQPGMIKATEDENLKSIKFPPVNSLTDIDEKYFSAIQSEAKWNYAANNKTKETTDDKADVDSNSMTQGDRDYFNVVKTEDGRSRFFKAQKYLRLVKKYNSEEQEHRSSENNHHF